MTGLVLSVRKKHSPSTPPHPSLAYYHLLLRPTLPMTSESYSLTQGVSSRRRCLYIYILLLTYPIVVSDSTQTSRWLKLKYPYVPIKQHSWPFIALPVLKPQSSICYTTTSSLKPKNFSNLIICGDFEIDSVDPSGIQHTTLTQSMLDFNLTPTVSEPTRIGPTSSSTIDLVLLSNYYSLSSYDIVPPLGSLDQHFVLTKIKLSSKINRSSLPTRKIWLYSQTDLTLVRF